ncbi:hypothetical protein BSKO_01584 [Bryopsis sp. KO-2023]|nr:hypothetical protein BSKO_01584 [Bryopsis sp. KO-2023]
MAPKKRKAEQSGDDTKASKKKAPATTQRKAKKEVAPKPKAPFYLFKSEPSCYSIDALAKEPEATTEWDGVRNYQARNLMQGMKVGDRGFYYHSNCKPPGIVGIVEVAKEAHPDYTAWDPKDDHYDPKSSEDDPRWFMVDIKLIRKLKRMISLPELKEYAGSELKDMVLVNKSRLSVQPVGEKEWEFIMGLEEQEESEEKDADE